MKIKGFIIGTGKIVTDGRTLRGMEKAGFFKYNPDGSGNPYVDPVGATHFSYKGCEYHIKYFDGCFYPFVVETTSE